VKQKKVEARSDLPREEQDDDGKEREDDELETRHDGDLSSQRIAWWTWKTLDFPQPTAHIRVEKCSCVLASF
jgi:hypothetical protein